MNCTRCEIEMVEYVYGFPNREMFKLAEDGKVLLGGNAKHEYRPTHYCTQCQEQYPPADESVDD